jgi:hypothetical protein
MMVLPTLEPPMMALPTLLPWLKHPPSYPPRMICEFCFEDSHKSKNHKCWYFWKKSDSSKAIAESDQFKMKNLAGDEFKMNILTARYFAPKSRILGACKVLCPPHPGMYNLTIPQVLFCSCVFYLLTAWQAEL